MFSSHLETPIVDYRRCLKVSIRLGKVQMNLILDRKFHLNQPFKISQYYIYCNRYSIISTSVDI